MRNFQNTIEYWKDKFDKLISFLYSKLHNWYDKDDKYIDVVNDMYEDIIYVDNQSESNTIIIGNENGEIIYLWDETKYILDGEITLNNALFNPSGKLQLTVGSSGTEEQIQEFINSGFLKMPSVGFPIMYIYDGSNWTKLSQDGSPYEC